MPTASDPVRSVLRALDILEYLAGRAAPAGHGEIADALGIPKSSLTELLRTLASRGYVASEPDARGFRSGPQLAALTARRRPPAELAEIAALIVARLSQEVGESAGLNLREGPVTRVICATNADQPLVYLFQMGSTPPLYATSSGKAILAALPPEELESYLTGLKMERLTPTTVRSVKALRGQLEEVRRDGFALSVEERHPGIVGIAMAIRDAEGVPFAGLNVAVPAARFDAARQARITRALGRAARALQARIGEQEGGG